jgi:hypothetical protein
MQNFGLCRWRSFGPAFLEQLNNVAGRQLTAIFGNDPRKKFPEN